LLPGIVSAGNAVYKDRPPGSGLSRAVSLNDTRQDLLTAVVLASEEFERFHMSGLYNFCTASLWLPL
jgi:hypothetical protein